MWQPVARATALRSQWCARTARRPGAPSSPPRSIRLSPQAIRARPARRKTAGPRPSAPAAAPARGLTHVSWSSFTDPYENAFTIEVPQGWTVAGGAVRKIPLWANLVLRVLSPDRRTLIAVGDPDSVPYSAPIAARDYVRRFTESAMSRACSGLKIVNVADLPDVERYASSNSSGPYTQWSAAQAAFTCNGARQAGMAGEAIAVLQYMTTLRSGHAQILATFVTTTGQEDNADRLLDHMIASLRQNRNGRRGSSRRRSSSPKARWPAGRVSSGNSNRWTMRSATPRISSHPTVDATNSTPGPATSGSPLTAKLPAPTRRRRLPLAGSYCSDCRNKESKQTEGAMRKVAATQ